MAVFNTEIIDTVADDKSAWSSLGAFIISQGCLKNWAFEQWFNRFDATTGVDVSQVTSQRNRVCFEISRNSLKGFKNFPRNLSKTDSTQIAERFLFLKIFLFQKF